MADDEADEVAAETAEPKDSIAIELAAQAEHFLWTFKSPQKAAEKLAEWVKANYPTKIATGYWITLTESRKHDKGVTIEVAKLPWALQLRAVVGRWSTGFGVYTRPFDVTQYKVKVSVGAGAVVPYDDLKKLTPMVGITVHF